MIAAARNRAAALSRPQWLTVAAVVLVGLLGAAVRLQQTFHPSPLYYGTYDDGVHFSAAVNLVHGHLPYRDVLFLQPPGVIVAASPFAFLAEAVGDARAFAAGRIAFALIGALNGALVAVALRRFGLGAVLVGGVLYALSFPALYDERTITLEVIGSTGVLASLVLLDIGARRGTGRWFLLAGVAAGVSIDFKIWYIATFVVLAVVAGRRILRFVVGGVIAGVVGYVPFFAAAPARMWQQVVQAQLGRPATTGTPLASRLRTILGVASADSTGRIPALTGTAVVAVLLVLVVLLVVAALTLRGARRYVALLAVTAAVLLGSPSFFQHYAVLTAGPLALVAGAGTVRTAELLGRSRGRRAVLGASVAVALLLAVGVDLRQDLGRSNQKVAPVAALRAGTAGIRGCLVADDPTILIVLNRLTPDLQRGCTVQSDPSGAGYVLVPKGGKQVFRPANPLWQHEFLSYARSADAYLLVRGKILGLTPASQAVVDGDRVLYAKGRFTVRSGR